MLRLALQSKWLTIHVITVSFASAVLSISFITGLIFLLKTVNPQQKSKQTFFLELIMYFLAIIYILIRFIRKNKVISLLNPFTQKVNISLMDKITHRAVIIGFPLFALGGLVFAMIWAQIAWSRFWGWDPKEVWSFITFLFYAALLHLRVGKGWEGEKTAWLAILGFGIIIFNQVFVNLVISGLHSDA
ncbi:cytochrome c biogenesis protein CcsA [Bacillus aquiflavi]|uniref:Cytochrome c biogenesis protein CcsA n=1 Tax=Bacillus aquiflavi TaxID=2672567 RepID=A0A6B3VQ15_9BACI|nr:cytochrome c biogenesis protein CcsA [Bacillus aquiflavi]NEY80400.1 cytochrome c biogenesis protein CcsA [Bacillus aquiflavi]